MPTYTANTRTLTAKPRSKRMQQGAIATAQVVQGGGSVQGNYLPATNNGDGYDVADKVAFLQKIRIGAPDTIVGGVVTQVNGIDVEVDTTTGAIHVKGGLYADDFISVMGLNPDAPTPGGGGLDEDELWQILGGASTNQHILSKYINNVAASAVQGLATVATSGSYNDLSNKPSSLPASDVYSWAKASTKPSYSWSEINGKPSTFTPSEHTHNYAGSSSAGGNANAALVLCGLNSSGAAQSGMTSRPTTANVTYADNKLRYYLATSSMTAGKPTNDGHIIHLSWDNGYYDVQLSVTHNGLAPFLQLRGQQGSSTYGSWSTILDSNNYSSYALPLSGGTLSGSLLSSNWTNKLGSSSGGFHELWLGGATSADMEYNTTNNPRIVFGGNSITQKVQIVYSHYDSYRAPRGLKIMSADNEDGLSTWLEVEDAIYANNYHAKSYVFLASGSNGIYLNSTGISWHDSSNVFTANLLVFDANGYTHCYHHLMLDGANASSSTANTTQIVFNASGTQQVALTSNANALIINPTTSSTTGQIILGVNGHYTALMSSGNTGIGTSSPTSKLHVVGDIYATGAITAGASSSDKRLKKDIKQFNAMSIVDALRPIQFRWNNVAKGLDKYFDTDEIQYGLIAQECDKAMPGLAFKFKANDYYGVRYEKLIPVLLEAIKELKQEINQLKEARA